MMIVVNESAAASYLYLMGLTIDEELPLTQHLSIAGHVQGLAGRHDKFCDEIWQRR